MTRTTTLMLALAGLTGCASSESQMWLFFLGEYDEADGESTCTENFNGANCPSGGGTVESEWTYDYTFARNNDRFFGEIIHGPGKEAYLVVGGEILVGTLDGKTYIFEWEEFSEETDSETHESGYNYSEYSKSSGKWKVEMTLDGKDASGTFAYEMNATTRYTETDTWSDADVGLYYGQIPASYYLEGDNPYNYPTDTDCSGSPCSLEMTSRGKATAPMTAVRTNGDEELLDAVQGAGDSPQSSF